MFAIFADGVPIGMIQASPAEPRHAAGPGACGIDLLIGVASAIGRGLGPRVIDAFVLADLFGRGGFSACLADPHENNVRSIRAFEKAGFSH